MVTDDQDLHGVPFPPARSSTNKVTSPLTREDASDNLSWKQRREMERLERLYAGQCPSPSPVETAWRHRDWLLDRARVYQAMLAGCLPKARQERFNACGAGCVVECHRDTKQMRVRGFFCGDRFCLVCAKSRAHRVMLNLKAWLKEHEASMVTMTLRGRADETCSQMLDRLIENFAKLRRGKVWRCVTGGAWSCEVKRGRRRRWWHVHIHALVNTQDLAEADLRAAWLAITGDSHQVKVDPVTDDEKAAWYVAKYVAKGWDRAIVKNPPDLLECLRSLCGRRLLATFGAERPMGIEDERPDPARWKCLGRLVTIIDQAAQGEMWAISVLSCVGRKYEVEDGETFHDHRALPPPAS